MCSNKKKVIAEELAQKEGEENVNGVEGEEVVANEQTVKELLIQRSLGEVLKVGLSRNHFRALGVIFGGIFALWNVLREFMEEEEILERAIGMGSSWMLGDYAIGILGLLVLTVLLSLVQVAIQFFRLSLFKTKEGFTWEAGLFTRAQRTASLRKIQFVQWYTDPLKQIWGFFTFKFFQAGSTTGSKNQMIMLPGNQWDEVKMLLAYVYPEYVLENMREQRISSKIVFRRLLYRGIIPAIAVSVLSVYMRSWWGLLWLLWIPVTYLLARRYYHRFRYYINEQFLVIRSGVWSMNYTLIPWRQAQGVSFSQGIYQRRHQLANLVLYSAAGSVEIPYMELGQSKELRDYLLYVVEKDNEPWM